MSTNHEQEATTAGEAEPVAEPTNGEAAVAIQPDADAKVEVEGADEPAPADETAPADEPAPADEAALAQETAPADQAAPPGAAAESHDVPRTVADALAEGLARAGVKIAFTVPGETVVSLLESLSARSIRVVATRHEGPASFMAAAVGQLTGRPAVCVATRGPGAANLAIGLHAAQADSAPLIAIVGQVNRDVRGRDAFQEMDVVRAFEPLVKWAAEVKDPADAVSMLERAAATAMKGRPGPVLLSVPGDILDVEVSGTAAQTHTIHPEVHPEPDPALVRKVVHLLTDARRPLILAGAGVLRARSTDALVKFAETIRVPVVASWRRADVFPNDNPLFLGMAGLGAAESVRERLESADALLVLGCRLNEITSYGYRIPLDSTRWAQVDVEPRGAASRHRPDIIMATDVGAFLRVAQRMLAHAAMEAASFDQRATVNAEDREVFELSSSLDSADWQARGIHPGQVMSTLAEALPSEAIVATDAGDFGTWAARVFRFKRPGTFLGSSAGPMGYALPAAIGATLARPGRLAVALAGDGGFAMTMAELETAVRERAHVVAVVFDNARYGTIWRHQEERGGKAGLATSLGSIDFAAAAVACGALGLTVRLADELEPALAQALGAGRPAVIHVVMDPAWTTPGREPATNGSTTDSAGAEAEPRLASDDVETSAEADS